MSTGVGVSRPEGVWRSFAKESRLAFLPPRSCHFPLFFSHSPRAYVFEMGDSPPVSNPASRAGSARPSGSVLGKRGRSSLAGEDVGSTSAPPSKRTSPAASSPATSSQPPTPTTVSAPSLDQATSSTPNTPATPGIPATGPIDPRNLTGHQRKHAFLCDPLVGPDATSVEPNAVFCKGCGNWVQLGKGVGHRWHHWIGHMQRKHRDRDA